MNDQKGSLGDTNWPLIFITVNIDAFIFFLKKKVQMARDRDITVSSLQNTLPSAMEREEDPPGPIQRSASGIPTASGDMAVFIYWVCLKLLITQDPFSPGRSCLLRYLIWVTLSHLSFTVSVLRLIRAGFPGPHIHSHCWVWCCISSLNQESSFSLKSFSSVLKPSHLPLSPPSPLSSEAHRSLLELLSLCGSCGRRE